MGWTVTASYELDDGNTPYDDQTVSIDTGNGTFFIQTNADKGGHNRLVPKCTVLQVLLISKWRWNRNW